MYSNFAKEFDHTRFSVWSCVQTFLSSIETPCNKKLLDAGCGNGKNMVYANTLGFQTVGFDVCPELVDICKSKGLSVKEGDIHSEITEKYDVILCIAVIHHFNNKEERNKILKNLYNALKPNGKLLVTTWSFELYDYEGKVFEKPGDNIVPWKSKLHSSREVLGERYYYIYDKPHFEELMNSLEIDEKNIKIDWEKQNWIGTITKPLFGTLNTIETFWKTHPQYWIAIKNQAEADKIITEKFYEYDYTKENAIGQIIYLDQFTRHFQRYKHLDEDISHFRLEACMVVDIIHEELYEKSELDVYFALMVYKHMNYYDSLFLFLEKYLKNHKKSLNDFPTLHKFFIDTYKKAYTFEKIYSDIQIDHEIMDYDHESICDYYPEEYKKENWIDYCFNEENRKVLEPIGLYLKKFSDGKKVVVSLSGGVDSMCMLALCKLFNIDCIAVHIVYGNREVSKQEYNFLVKYCMKLYIPFYSYTIEHLKRGHVERGFYEQMTRDIRFFVYRAVGGKDCHVYLGHIKDDVIENIWSNFAKGIHLDDLKMMKQIERQMDVYICRPFLEYEKAQIYSISNTLFIPYLKNTTPTWSNRGKFRTTFYKAIHEQYTSSVDEKVCYVADVLSEQTKLIYRLLYEPILSSYESEKRSLDISRAIEGNVDIQCWNYIFENLCHKILGISKPSIHAIKDFHKRIERMVQTNDYEKYIHLKSDLIVFIKKTEHKYLMLINK